MSNATGFARCGSAAINSTLNPSGSTNPFIAISPSFEASATFGDANDVGVNNSPALAPAPKPTKQKNKKPFARATLTDNIARKVKAEPPQFKSVAADVRRLSPETTAFIFPQRSESKKLTSSRHKSRIP